MRTSLIPGLLTSLRHNLNHGRKDVRLFEIGRAFSGGSPGELPSECECLALLASEASWRRNAAAARETDSTT